MCGIAVLNIDGRRIRVADIKQKYMANIIEAARKCEYIDKIVLFGSACNSRCTEKSDIDLAIFGNQTKYRFLCSGKYRAFLEQIYVFDDHRQAYDFLYFKTGSQQKSQIMNDIEEGEVLYVRPGYSEDSARSVLASGEGRHYRRKKLP